MARAKRSKTKPAIKSSAQKVPKIGWGQSSRNVTTLRNIEKAKFGEAEVSISTEGAIRIDVGEITTNTVYIVHKEACSSCGSEDVKERSGSMVCFNCGTYQ